MWLNNIYAWLFYENTSLAIIFFIAVFALTVSSFIGYRYNSVGVYTALAVIIGGLTFIIGSLYGAIAKYAWRCTAVLCVYGGVIELVLRIVFGVKKRIKNRRESRAKIERELKFTLPEKDNSFIRARLNTVLKQEEPEKLQETQTKDFQLSYAKQLLVKLKESKLSTADSLKTEEFSSLLALYANKEKYTPNDLRTLNDALSGLLKLSAKYCV